jgi:hypothetical protein
MGHHSKFIISNFLHSVIPPGRMIKVARRDDDAIPYDPLRMRMALGIYIYILFISNKHGFISGLFHLTKVFNHLY